MFTTIAKIFGKSPFKPLQLHMEKVADCFHKLPELLPALHADDLFRIQKISKEICHLEHQADLTKNDIRNHLPSTLFMPIDRAALLDILTLQDSFADRAEDIAITLTLKSLGGYPHLREEFETFFEKNISSFFLAKDLVGELTALLETSFGGTEASKVHQMVKDLAYKEHEVDRLQYHLIQRLYNEDLGLDYKDFSLWLELIKEVASLSNLAENLANRMDMLLESR